jgi:hypothetical protein
MLIRIRNVPFLMVMIGNLPAVMGLYIPYMFLPAVSDCVMRLMGPYNYTLNH